MNENLVKYLLKYQTEDFKPEYDEKNKEEKLHYGFIYGKIMKNKYSAITIKNAG